MSSEPSPIDSGAVIVLNGASSSGKSTLAHRMHTLLDLPFLLLSGDQLIEAGVVPPRRDFDEIDRRADRSRRRRSNSGHLGPRGLERDLTRRRTSPPACTTRLFWPA